MNLCPSDSVGLIAKKDSKYLMLERLKHPMGLACVAGHRDVVNGIKEDFTEAGFREWLEETGSTAKGLKFILAATFPNPCSRLPGFDGHQWRVYEVTSWVGEPQLMEPTKHGFVKWMSSEEIQEWIQTGKPTDPAWFKFIFPALANQGNEDAKRILGISA